jgi:peptidoglycan/LPS O-acetylase OafA/YrhL
MTKKIYFNHLDAIRFFAALAIFLGHGFLAWRGYFSANQGADLPEFVKTFMTNTGLGVEWFFYISGFLITYILLKEKEATGKIAIAKFFIRRALRIWPLYFLLIAITPLLISWMPGNDPHYVPNLLFIGNFDVIWDGQTHFPFSHFWSIAVEEQFYLIWPFVIAFIPRKRLMPVFLILIGVSIFARYSFVGLENQYQNLYYHTLCRMDTLVIGAISALYFDKYAVNFVLKKGVLLLTFLGLFALLFFTVSNDWVSVPSALGKKYIYLIPMALITLHFVSNNKPHRFPKLSNIINYLGKSSYGLYMIHNFVVLIVVDRVMLNNGLNIGWLFWVIYAVITFALVFVSFEFLEKPFLKLKKHFSVIKTRKF